jgi:hypothetical protein
MDVKAAQSDASAVAVSEPIDDGATVILDVLDDRAGAYVIRRSAEPLQQTPPEPDPSQLDEACK